MKDVLFVLLAQLVISTSGVSDRAARPQQRPTALRATSTGVLPSLRSQVETIGSSNPLHLAARAGDRSTSTALLARSAQPEYDALTQALRHDGDGDNRTAAELTGVQANHHGHFSTKGWTCLINMSVVTVCALAFSFLRLRLPIVYSGNVLAKVVPVEPKATLVGWLSASWQVTTEEAAESVGLDVALMIEFCTMSCKMLAIIGVPMTCIMCPLHYLFGDGGTPFDELGSITMGNVVYGHPWLYYVHALIVNVVTLFVIHVVYSAMPNFLRLRYNWLKHVSAPWCQTVLVEGIPPGWRTDAQLREFFATMFKPEFVSECTVVKDAPVLLKLFTEQTEYSEMLREYKDKWQASNYVQEERPMMREPMCIGKRVDAIDYIEKKLAELKPQVEEARILALKDAEVEGATACASGFVTFTRRREAEVCHNIATLGSRRDEWLVSIPPPASDVRWSDLKQTERKKAVFASLGYFCTVMLFLMFLPLVVLGTNLTRSVQVNGPLKPIWESFAPGLALMLFLAFLPTILLTIFSCFFSLKSEVFAQHRLQVWYFGFMVVFVILVTVVGRSLIGTFTKVVTHPDSALKLLAENMPSATDFYLDFLMLQWGEQAINFLRFVPLAKFLFFRNFFEEEDAKQMAEPEDQDFYGIGSRSARFTVSLLIGIIFSTLSPLISLAALVLFILMRIFYGYSVVYAETKKPDLGGVFYETKLQHLILGVGVYAAVMIGVLCFRADSKAPMMIAMPSLLYAIWSYWHFSHNFVWKELPFSEVCQRPEELKAEDSGLHYVQPEFAAPATGLAAIMSTLRSSLG